MHYAGERRDQIARALRTRHVGANTLDVPPRYYHVVNDARGECCKTCVFFEIYGSYPDRGDCRRRAPVQRGSEHGSFPLVASDSWCGEYERFSAEAIAEGLSFPEQQEDETPSYGQSSQVNGGGG